MAKFRIRLKVQGFELEVDGEREDIPAITAAVQKQFAGLIQPAEDMADDHKQIEAGSQTLDAELAKPPSRSKGKRNTTAKASVDGPSGQPIDFRHDPSKYGNPEQSWSVLDKCVWMLFVLEGITTTKEVSGPQLTSTFNGQFKSSGKVHPPNVSRDLGRAKVQNPALVGEDKGLWYLTEKGKEYAQQMIDKVLNPTAA
jgi:hypothetical protein